MGQVHLGIPDISNRKIISKIFDASCTRVRLNISRVILHQVERPISSSQKCIDMLVGKDYTRASQFFRATFAGGIGRHQSPNFCPPIFSSNDDRHRLSLDN
jgi:hypothetical protein